MAKRRSKKTSARKRSGSPKMKVDFMSIGGNIVGAIASKVLVSKLPIQNNLIKSVAPIALGVFLSGNKNNFIKNTGLGMIAVGGSEVVKTLVPGLAGMSEFLGQDDFPMLEGASGDVLSGDVLSGNGGYYATINGDSTSADFMAGTDEFIAGSDDYMA